MLLQMIQIRTMKIEKIPIQVMTPNHDTVNPLLEISIKSLFNIFEISY